MIRARLDYLLLDRQMTLTELAAKTGLALNKLVDSENQQGPVPYDSPHSTPCVRL